jgi:hypothetical protein
MECMSPALIWAVKMAITNIIARLNRHLIYIGNIKNEFKITFMHIFNKERIPCNLRKKLGVFASQIGIDSVQNPFF